MKNGKYIFVGNRFYVLEKMMDLGLKITDIFAVENSYLERELVAKNARYQILPSKKEFIDKIDNLKFDYLISNGCPYILPISKLEREGKKFINIHPSLLPDLQGKNPINGALLYGRRHGVTCHYMDDGIDTGGIISQIEIPITDDLNLDLLYQISFRTEGVVFEEAYKKDFAITGTKNTEPQPIYYSRKSGDNVLHIEDGLEAIRAKVRAFNSRNQYAVLENGLKKYNVIGMTVIENEAAQCLFEKEKKENIVYMIYGGKYVLFRLYDKLIQFEIEDMEGLRIGDKVV